LITREYKGRLLVDSWHTQVRVWDRWIMATRVFTLAEAALGELLNHEFEPAFPKLDRTGLKLRKSIALNVLRFSG
jgi:hypothetical protein